MVPFCITFCYNYGMSIQIAVRLSEDIVEFIDQLVESGKEPSRAAVVARALSREKRRMIAARDAEILAHLSEYDELSDLAAYATRSTLELD